mmetsp:Transcript_55483/g.127492  ORF Transcript_55483/g.127492 Transcript_55483/m.127492 type:complete len:101 (-) Transcript_55483:235-537(-)
MVMFNWCKAIVRTLLHNTLHSSSDIASKAAIYNSKPIHMESRRWLFYSVWFWGVRVRSLALMLRCLRLEHCVHVLQAAQESLHVMVEFLRAAVCITEKVV